MHTYFLQGSAVTDLRGGGTFCSSAVPFWV